MGARSIARQRLNVRTQQESVVELLFLAGGQHALGRWGRLLAWIALRSESVASVLVHVRVDPHFLVGLDLSTEEPVLGTAVVRREVVRSALPGVKALALRRGTLTSGRTHISRCSS